MCNKCCLCVFHTNKQTNLVTVKQVRLSCSIKICEKCFQVPKFLSRIVHRMHQGHQYRTTRKADASILVGGCESSAGRRLMQYVPVRWSHKHCNCSRLPLAGQHRRGIMWTSTSWYHGLLILLRTSFAGASEIRTWNWNWRANLWTGSLDASSSSAFFQFVWLKDVSGALIYAAGQEGSSGC